MSENDSSKARSDNQPDTFPTKGGGTVPVSQEAKDFMAKLYPCEPPCDSYGICDNCLHQSDFEAGYTMGYRASSTQPDHTQTQLMRKLEVHLSRVSHMASGMVSYLAAVQTGGAWNNDWCNHVLKPWNDYQRELLDEMKAKQLADTKILNITLEATDTVALEPEVLAAFLGYVARVVKARITVECHDGRKDVFGYPASDEVTNESG